jgi:hypothetical protein
MKQSNVRRGILVALFVLFAASPAHANAFLPIVMVSWFGMFVALIPIVLIEWTIVAQITGFTGLALLAVAAANLVSTVVGVPFSLVVEVVVMGIVGVNLYEESPVYDDAQNKYFTWERFRMAPVWGLMALAPFFLLSWWLEAVVAGWILDDLPGGVLNTAIRDANLVTYAILALLVAGFLFRLVLPLRRKARSKDQAMTTAVPDTDAAVATPATAVHDTTVVPLDSLSPLGDDRQTAAEEGEPKSVRAVAGR